MTWSINYSGFVEQLLPPDLRRERILALLACLVFPLKEVNYLFVDFTGTINYWSAFNGQVVYLEHLLNDLFDEAERRIYIDDPVGIEHLPPVVYNKVEDHDGPIVYNKSEAQDGPYLYNEVEFDGMPDFVVMVPQDLDYTAFEPYLRAIINKYRLASKRYVITEF